MSSKLGTYKCGFIILHYNDLETTIKCIESIQCLECIQDIKVLIVDNHSPNNSGSELKNKYTKSDNIEVLLLEDNYGYSKANNIGYSYLRESGEYDYIIVANNDIIFEQKNMIPILQQKYKKEEFFLAGPDVFAIYKKQHQNPLALRPRSLKETEEWIEDNQKCLKHMRREYFLHCIWAKVTHTKIYALYRKKLDEKKQKQEDKGWMVERENVVLSGSCLFFSQKFIENNEKLFDPETYFYHEEDILTTKCLKNGWKTLYIPDIKVQHLEGASTNTKNYDQKMKFRYTNFIKAAEIYANYLKQNNYE